LLLIAKTGSNSNAHLQVPIKESVVHLYHRVPQSSMHLKDIGDTLSEKKGRLTRVSVMCLNINL
jgi:hypothetical protein